MNSQPRLLSIFDILGPIMTGPSSSDTAGATRIGLMGRQFLGSEPESVTIHFYSSLAATYKGHMTDSGVVAGLMGFGVDAPEIADALSIATTRGISVVVDADVASDRNPSTIGMDLKSKDRSAGVSGLTVGGGEILVTAFDGFPVELHGNESGFFAVFRPGATDPGKIAGVTGYPVETLSLVQGENRAMVLGTGDEPLSRERLERLRLLPGIERANSLHSLLDYALRDSTPAFSTFAEMIDYARASGLTLPEAVEAYECRRSGVDGAFVRRKLRAAWMVMLDSAERGLKGRNRLVGGLLPGDDGAKLLRAFHERRTLSGDVLPLAVARALAVMEVNGCMGRIVAAPTAGACGVVPGALITAAEKLRSTPEEIDGALLVAAITGLLIANVAPISGAIGGCQSEIGVASAMAAAALAQMGGGTPVQVTHAAALALKGVLGMTCDQAAGPVEVPCVKRNAIGAANAFSSADMALAGIESVIPPDEVVLALRNIQTLMPVELRDTTLGGLGSTPTAARLKAELLERYRTRR